jgi:DNA-binding GntR family transcriptional regulator
MEGLVQQIDRRGFRVADVSVPELADLTKARCWVNEVALTQSIMHGGPEWEESVLIAYHRLARTSPQAKKNAPPGRAPEWEKAHHAFHTSLISGCGSNWMIEMCERMFNASERYRHVGRRAGVKPGGRDEEHRAIMQATIDRDVATAVRRLNEHYQKTAQLVRHVVGGDAKSGPSS